MRLLKLRFKNINSLLGDWTIDFQNPAYLQDGLFAITGPTGAGKTTILDAICLALFGKTPRVMSINANSNELMSLSAATCQSEVTFENSKGTFRCTFSQSKARGKSDGKLQGVKWEIADAVSGEVKASTKSETEKLIKETIQLDYDQFVRTIMLAQGKFKEFIDAKPNERADLLEKITGTGIYSIISENIFSRTGQEKKKLDQLELVLKEVVLLSAEEVAQLIQQKTDSNNQIAILTPQIDELDKQISWLEKTEQLQTQFDKIQVDISDNKTKLQQFENQRQQLKRDSDAAPLIGEHKILEKANHDVSQRQSVIDSNNSTIDSLEQNLTDIQTQIPPLENELETAKRNRQQQQPVISRVQALDGQIQSENEQTQKTKSDVDKRRAEFIEQCRKAKIAPENLPDKTIPEIQEQLSQALQGISVADKLKLIERFGKLKKRWVELEVIKQRIVVGIQKQRADNLSIIQQQKQLEEKTVQCDKSTKELETSKAHLDELERQIQFAETIKTYQQKRKELQDGQPCPLCGATNHPFCTEVPEVSAEKQELESLKSEYRKLEKENKNQEKEKTKIEQTIELIQTALKTTAESLEKDTAESDKICKKVLACDTDISVKEIKHRINRIEIKSQKVNDCIALISQLETQLKILQAKTEFDQAEQNYQNRQAQLLELLKQRADLFGNQNPVEVLNSLNAAIDSANTKLNQAQNRKITLETNLTNARQNRENAKGELKNLAEYQQKQSESFTNRLAQAGFTSIEDFQAAILPDAMRQEYIKQQKQLDSDKISLEEKHKFISEQLNTEREKNLTDKTKPELAQLREQLKSQRDELHTKTGAIVERIKDNDEQNKRFQQKNQQRDAQKLIYEKWERLNALIGSADGKKYQKIVQRMSLDILIDYANVQLQNLSDRYRLTLQESDATETGTDSTSTQSDNPDSESPSPTPTKVKSKKSSIQSEREKSLSIFCVDYYQGDEVRSVKNLSGGESFLVSLALALGLSQMSSNNITIETLFLDEGFGTLDEQTLQTALEAISRFQYSDGTNKLIGIISHVEALKEQIENKITVTPVQPGVSKLSGPGVSHSI